MDRQLIELIKKESSQVKAIEKTMLDILNAPVNSENDMIGRYTSYKQMATAYNDFVDQSESIKVLQFSDVSYFALSSMGSPGSMTWPQQKELFELVLLKTRILLSKLETNLDIVNDEIINLTNFIQNSLRASMFEIPQNEKIVQNTLESLFLGRGMSKGNDYKRESGRVDYSSKQFIPDFNLDSLSLAIEVKLIKKIADRSKVIDEINADIPAYQTKYDNIIFVVYDLGIIRNIEEFKADIENNIGIQVIVIKH